MMITKATKIPLNIVTAEIASDRYHGNHNRHHCQHFTPPDKKYFVDWTILHIRNKSMLSGSPSSTRNYFSCLSWNGRSLCKRRGRRRSVSRLSQTPSLTMTQTRSTFHPGQVGIIISHSRWRTSFGTALWSAMRMQDQENAVVRYAPTEMPTAGCGTHWSNRPLQTLNRDQKKRGFVNTDSGGS